MQSNNTQRKWSPMTLQNVKKYFDFSFQKAPFGGGGLALNVCDNVLLVHHRSSGTTALYDIALSVESDGQVTAVDLDDFSREGFENFLGSI